MLLALRPMMKFPNKMRPKKVHRSIRVADCQGGGVKLSSYLSSSTEVLQGC